jgi:hypothetical protein
MSLKADLELKGLRALQRHPRFTDALLAKSRPLGRVFKGTRPNSLYVFYSDGARALHPPNVADILPFGGVSVCFIS